MCQSLGIRRRLESLFLIFSRVSSLPLRTKEDAEQNFRITANHSCWDWVTRREGETEGEEQLEQREKESAETKVGHGSQQVKIGFKKNKPTATTCCHNFQKG